jgi:hypothetical protein
MSVLRDILYEMLISHRPNRFVLTPCPSGKCVEKLLPVCIETITVRPLHAYPLPKIESLGVLICRRRCMTEFGYEFLKEVESLQPSGFCLIPSPAWKCFETRAPVCREASTSGSLVTHPAA